MPRDSSMHSPQRDNPTSLNGPSVPAGDPRALTLLPMLRLRWFIRLRWLFLGGAVVVLGLERLVLTNIQRPFALASTLMALAVVNVLWTVVSHVLLRPVPTTPASAGPAQLGRPEIFANVQVAVDLLLLTTILRYTGGAENPLAIFYLFHMAIVSLLLPPWQAILQGVWAVLLYALLVIGEWQSWLAPHYRFLPAHDIRLYTQVEYVFAVLLVVACGIFGTLYFTLHIARQMHAQERELQRTNAALRQSQIAIQDLQHRRSRFMQTAAHQLKSPLAVIQTLTELIRSAIVPPEAITDTCDRIIRRCREGIGQVSELLTLARVQEADPARHRRSQADVRQTVAELCRHFRPLAESKQIELTEWVPEEGDLKVSVDPQDLKDCVGNLIDNAIKYTQGPGRVRVTVTSKAEDGRPVSVGIHVSDTGMGIDASLLRSANGEPTYAAVFDAFRRGANVIAAGIPGTGLGLSIVREVVEQAGGRIWVVSRPGAGSSFTITLPVTGMGGDQPLVRNTRGTEVVLEAPPESAAAGDQSGGAQQEQRHP